MSGNKADAGATGGSSGGPPDPGIILQPPQPLEPLDTIRDIPLDEIRVEHLEALVGGDPDRTRELSHVDYKRELGFGEKHKRDFALDVVAFANAGGGDLVFGIDAPDGAPVALTPAIVDGRSPDDAILLLSNVLSSIVEPRLFGVSMRPVGSCLVVRVPRSWGGPHAVRVGASLRFVTRGPAGNVDLDFQGLRSAFLAADSRSERLTAFRDGRVARILSGNAALPLVSTRLAVLHIVPFASVEAGFSVDLRAISKGVEAPGSGFGWTVSRRYVLEGLIHAWTTAPNAQSPRTPGRAQEYTLWTRHGQVEHVSDSIDPPAGPEGTIHAGRLEGEIIRNAGRNVRLLERLGVPPPFVLFVTVVGCEGAALADAYPLPPPVEWTIDRDVLALPEVVLSEVPPALYDDDHALAQLLRPVFDALWNAAGLRESGNYTAEGEWDPDGRYPFGHRR